MTSNDRTAGWASLGVLYLVWGTGCPAIKLCLDRGFGPFGLGASRLLAAALGVAFFALYTGRIFDRSEVPRVLWVGVLFWIVGSGLQVWGQQGVSAGVAALVLGTTPLVGSILQGWSLRSTLCLGVSLSGLLVAAEGGFEPVAVVALFGSAVVAAWASAGAQRLESDVMWVAALQLAVGAVGQAVAMVLTGEAIPSPGQLAWISWGWLVLGPAVLGMMAYVVATRALPLTTVLTYAIVNPVVALVVGWAVLGEPLGVRQVVGVSLVAGGVGALLAQGSSFVWPNWVRPRLGRSRARV